MMPSIPILPIIISIKNTLWSTSSTRVLPPQPRYKLCRRCQGVGRGRHTTGQDEDQRWWCTWAPEIGVSEIDLIFEIDLCTVELLFLVHHFSKFSCWHSLAPSCLRKLHNIVVFKPESTRSDKLRLQRQHNRPI